MSASAQSPRSTEPWWRIKMLWLVIGGPLVVVVASFVTLYLAVSRPDPVLQVHAADESPKDAAHVPAMQARNHVQTGGMPPPEQKK